MLKAGVESLKLDTHVLQRIRTKLHTQRQPLNPESVCQESSLAMLKACALSHTHRRQIASSYLGPTPAPPSRKERKKSLSIAWKVSLPLSPAPCLSLPLSPSLSSSSFHVRT